MGIGFASGWAVMVCGLVVLNTNKHGFHFQNHGTTTKKASYFLIHVDLGVIELKALKHTRGGGARGVGGGGESSDDGDDWTKKKNEMGNNV